MYGHSCAKEVLAGGRLWPHGGSEGQRCQRAGGSLPRPHAPQSASQLQLPPGGQQSCRGCTVPGLPPGDPPLQESPIPPRAPSENIDNPAQICWTSAPALPCRRFVRAHHRGQSVVLHPLVSPARAQVLTCCLLLEAVLRTPAPQLKVLPLNPRLPQRNTNAHQIQSSSAN